MGIRTYPDQQRVYIDMDGTSFDFEGAAQDHGVEPRHLKLIAGAYRNLKLLPGTLEAIRAFEEAGFYPFLLTKIPSSNPYAATEKLLCVREAIPHLADRIIITPDKGCVGTAIDCLVDDRLDWANCQAFAGTKIAFEGDWPSVVAQVLATRTAKFKPDDQAADAARFKFLLQCEVASTRLLLPDLDADAFGVRRRAAIDVQRAHGAASAASAADAIAEEGVTEEPAAVERGG
jgi:hypothetical protein